MEILPTTLNKAAVKLWTELSWAKNVMLTEPWPLHLCWGGAQWLRTTTKPSPVQWRQVVLPFKTCSLDLRAEKNGPTSSCYSWIVIILKLGRSDHYQNQGIIVF